jgi:hypothetical protein
MKRFLSAWLAILVGMGLLTGFGILMALLSGYIADRTNVWVGTGVMLAFVSLLVTWWMRAPLPAWLKRMIVEGFESPHGQPVKNHE